MKNNARMSIRLFKCKKCGEVASEGELISEKSEFKTINGKTFHNAGCYFCDGEMIREK